MLYIVATPIGNLGDFSFRAVEILKSCDLILTEDTRKSSILLNKYAIKKPLKSFHEHSSQEKLSSVVEELNKGKTLALLSDAGTPGLSDPGGKLIAKAIENKIQVIPIPGPSALTALISVAPFATTEFVFLGFFPKKKGREKIIEEIKSYKKPVYFFESPKRIRKTLLHFKEKLPDFSVLIGRELTKIHEEIVFIPLQDLQIDEITEKGEFVFALYK